MKRSLLSLLICVLVVTGCGDSGGSGGVDEDYLEITSVEPGSVDEGVETSFVISFDYRLVSESSAYVLVGFNDDVAEPNRYPVEDVMVLEAPTAGSETITVSANPVYYELPERYRIYVNLSPLEHGSPWRPLAGDTWEIDVNPGASASSAGNAEKQFHAKTKFVKCAYEECFNQND